MDYFRSDRDHSQIRENYKAIGEEKIIFLFF